MNEASGPIYVRSEHVLARRIVGETILVPVHGKLANLQRVFALNPVAEFVWDRLDGRRTLSEVAAGVAEEFEVTVEQALADVLEHVAQLAEDGLVQRAAP